MFYGAIKLSVMMESGWKEIIIIELENPVKNASFEAEKVLKKFKKAIYDKECDFLYFQKEKELVTVPKVDERIFKFELI